MEHDAAGAHELADAVAIRAARRELDLAIADLVAAPLDQDTADRMQEVLDSPRLRRARTAFRRLTSSPAAARASHLKVVERATGETEKDPADEDIDDPWDPVIHVGGAA